MPLSELEELELLELEKAKAMSSKSGADPTEMESLGRGAAQGLSLGFRDEMAGALKSPVGALKKATTFLGYKPINGDQDLAAYLTERNASRSLDEKAQKANPNYFLGGEVLGGAATAVIPGMGLTKGATALNAAKAGLTGGAIGAGNSQSDELSGLAADTGIGAGLGAGGSIAAEKVISPLISKGAEKSKAGFQKLSDVLKGKAENLAENATGATRVQSEKYAPGAGRQLLDRKLVRFGDAPKNIAQRTENLMTASEKAMDSTLSKLDDMGVKASPEEILAQFDERIATLAADPSKAQQARALETIKNDVANSLKSADPKLSTIEQWKRGFKKVNWQDQDAAIARKEAYRTLMKTVEDKAVAADKTLADKFVAAKKDYGLMAPIQEAAEKRATQLNQHPILGLNDIATAGASSAAGVPFAGLPGVVARRMAAPRISSSAAVTLDKLGSLTGSIAKNGPVGPAASSAINRVLPMQAARQVPTDMFKQVAGGSSAPEVSTRDRGPQSQQIDRARALQKVAGTPYEAPLKAAAERGENSFAATYFLMSQQDPEFRQKMENTNER